MAELTSVVSILVILATVPIMYVSFVRRKSEEAQMKANLRLVRAALDRCFNDTGMYPANLSDLGSPTVPALGIVPTTAARIAGTDYSHYTSGTYPPRAWRGPYLRSVPVDTQDGFALNYSFTTGCSYGQLVCLHNPDTTIDGSPFASW